MDEHAMDYLKKVHAFTMIAKYQVGIGGAKDSLEELIADGDPHSHMSIRIGTGNYYRAESVLAALDDLYIKAMLDSFTSSDKLLSTIFKDNGVMDVYAEYRK